MSQAVTITGFVVVTIINGESAEGYEDWGELASLTKPASGYCQLALFTCGLAVGPAEAG